MISRLLALLLVGSVPFVAQAADVYRWTDETGRVNYGNIVPDRYKSAARKVDAASQVVNVQPPAASTAQRGTTPADPSASTGAGSPPVTGPGGVGY